MEHQQAVSTPEFDLPSVGHVLEPANRILVMSAPRTGSAAMMDMLGKAGLGHNPVELLHHLSCAANKINSQNALAFIRQVAEQKGTPEGFFSCKVHFNQLERVFANAEPLGAAWLTYFNRFILMRRRDRIAQAISEYFALKTNVWSLQADQPDQLANARVYTAADLAPVAMILARQIREDRSWLAIISKFKLEALEVFYEDFMASPRETMEKVAAYLGIALPADFEPSFPSRKASDPKSISDFRAAFYADLGISSMNASRIE